MKRVENGAVITEAIATVAKNVFPSYLKKKGNMNSDNNKSFRNYLIKEPNSNQRMLLIPGTCGKKDIDILVDTGAEGNYICKRTVQILKLEIKECEKESRVIYGNRISSKVLGIVNFEVSFRGN